MGILQFAFKFLGAQLYTLCNKVGQNRMLLLLLAYAAMLALIGTLWITFFLYKQPVSHRFGQFTVGEEVAQKERLYELSSTSLHPRKLSMQTAYFIVIALINSALLSIYGMWPGSCVHLQKQSKYIY